MLGEGEHKVDGNTYLWYFVWSLKVSPMTWSAAVDIEQRSFELLSLAPARPHRVKGLEMANNPQPGKL